MSKAQFPDQGRPESESREVGRGAEAHAEENRDSSEDLIWRSIAALSKARIESRLGEQPSAKAKPIRSALAELESKLALAASEDRGEKFEKGLRGLDQRLSDIARRLDQDAAHQREAKSSAPSDASAAHNAASAQSERAAPGGDAPVHRPLLDAIAQITERQRVLDDALGGSEPASASRMTALQRSIDSVARHLDGFREDAAERGDQQLVMMRQIENVRREIQDMARAIGELAPRASVAAIDTALADLRQRIDLQRDRGVSDETLAPAENIISELRAVIEDLDPTPVVRNLRADVETIGVRLEKLQKGDVAQASAVRELACETHEIKEQLAALMARPLPLEKIEARIIDVTQRVDALRLSCGASGADLGEVATKIRSIIAAETGKGLESFNNRLDRLAQKLDAVVVQTAAARFDELGDRIDELGKTITKRMDRGAADMAPLEALVAKLAEKIDGALDGASHASAFEEIGRRFDNLESRFVESAPSESLARIEAMLAEPNGERQFADLSQRIDELRQTFAARMESATRAGDLGHIAAIEELLRGLDGKLDAALSSDARHLDLQAIERELAQLSFKIDRLDDPLYAPRFSDQNSRLEEIAERLERVHDALAQRVESGARAEKRESELAALIESLADRIDRPVEPAADSEALKSLETQIDALSRRLERIDAGSGALIGFESKIDDLLARLEDTRSETAQAAEEALRRAAAEILRETEKVQQWAARRVRRDDNDDCHVSKDSAAPGTADGQNAESKEVAPLDPMEFLLPVDDRVVDGRGNFSGPLSGAERVGFRTSVQSDFIAAARRATQPATDAASGEGAIGDATPEGGAVVRLGAALRERKRPLLLSLAAIMLLIGAYQMARLSGRDGLIIGPSLRQQEAKAPAKAVLPPSSPETPLASKEAPSIALAERPVAAQQNIDPMPTGAIEATPLSPGDALAAIKRLAVEGDPAAQYEMGARLVEGRGAARDAKAAARWFEKAAETGLVPAQYRLGSMYEKGVGVERDYGLARLWYERAAGSGNARAMHNFAVLLAEGGDGKPDYVAAADWFRRAAEYGVRDSQFNLAILYARGLGVSRDLVQAYAWLSAAADQGDDDAAKKRDEIGARLDSRELAAAKSIATGFRVKAPIPEANDVPVFRTGGGEGAREQPPVKPPVKAPSGKPRVSQL
ncbi:SEL1-like repeat protein [Methylocystis sp. B8]|uniref:SEL1-like repeat protein n=1 Tax=Methylocystis sp. B8 TaxID=544938 RepID=UPI0010FD2DB5|nr:SEL1-like repeat protein [Methylocystis sp. B8]TLG78719.1 peptidoglycan-binding protein [Methylocystis sp. B8]